MRMRTPTLTRMSLLVATALFVAGCGDNTTAESHFTKGSEYFEAGQFSASTVELSNALKKQPDMAQARLLMARVSLELGEFDKAERDFQRAMQLGVPRGAVQPLLARSLLLQGAFDRALAETSVPPSDASPEQQAALLGIRAQTLAVLGDLQEAEGMAQEALALFPDDTGAIVALILVQSSRSELEKANEHVEKIISLAPELPEAWAIAGDVSRSLGKLEEAEQHFSKAISHRAYPSLDLARRAQVRLELGKLDEAEQDLRQLSRSVFAGHPFVNHIAGLIALARNDLKEAANRLEASFVANPGFIPNRVYLAIVRLRLGETEQALRHASFVQAQLPNSPIAQQLLGSVHLNRGSFETALKLLSQSQESPQDPTFLRVLASTALLAGDYDKALNHAEALVQLDPESSDHQRLLTLTQLFSNQTLLPNPGVSGENSDDFLLLLDALRSNRYAEVLAIYRTLSETHPDNPSLINIAAMAHVGLGDISSARTILEQSLKLNPEDRSTRINLANLSRSEGDYSAVKSLLSPLIADNIDDERLVLIFSEAEARLGNAEEAVKLLQAGLAKLPESLNIRSGLATLLLANGEYAQMLVLLQGLQPQQFQQKPELLYLLGRASLQNNDIPSAIQHLEQSIRLMPPNADIHFHLAEAKVRGGNFEGALAAIEQAISLDAEHTNARIAEIQLLTHLSRFQQAHQRLEPLLNDFEGQPEVLIVAARFQLLTGQFAQARDTLETAIAQQNSSELTTMLVRALWGLELYDEALAHLNGWIAVNPSDVSASLHLAGAYLDLERIPEAILVYQNVLKIHPDHVPTLNNLAWFLRKSDTESALKHIQHAANLAPEDPFVLNTMGAVMLETGDAARARFFVAQALAAMPENPEIKLHMAEVLIALKRWTEAENIIAPILANPPSPAIEQQAKSLSALMPSKR